jgi:hypothetical protein
MRAGRNADETFFKRVDRAFGKADAALKLPVSESDSGSIILDAKRSDRFGSRVRFMHLVDSRRFSSLWSNQTPEPTALAVTISACAELAPASAVAHL